MLGLRKYFLCFSSVLKHEMHPTYVRLSLNIPHFYLFVSLLVAFLTFILSNNPCIPQNLA
jgi:hypothetical protein